MGIFGKPPETRPADVPARPSAATAQSPLPRSAPCVIGAKTTIKGELTGDEDVVVEGTVEGEIRVAKALLVASSGLVKATVSAQSVVVSGEIVGDCQASQRVEIQATGRLTGNIRAPKIVIAEGAVFKGNSDMSGRKDERREHPATLATPHSPVS
jgi:cytoskeletal protein CcmA (bactofilin family)